MCVAVITIKGNIINNDQRARIHLRHPIRDLIPPGTNQYTMELCLDTTTAQARIKELTNKHLAPIILYFQNEEQP